MVFQIRHATFKSLFPDGAQLGVVAADFTFTEGPIWHPTNQFLIFSDIAESKQYRWDAKNGLSLFRTPSNQANGNYFDAEGQVITCEHAS